MISLPSNFKALTIDMYAFGVDNNYTFTTFYYRDENGVFHEYKTRDAVREREEVTVVSVGEEVNGFRRVEYSNGKIGFQTAEGKLISYKFNIASDFNACGLAMVGLNGGVTWINSEFKKLTSKGNWTMMEDEFSSLPLEVSDFVAGLSSVEVGRMTRIKAFFIDQEGKRMEFFHSASGSTVNFEGKFSNGSSFEESGYKITSEGVYFACGQFLTFEEVVKLPQMDAILSTLNAGMVQEKMGKSLHLGKIAEQKEK